MALPGIVFRVETPAQVTLPRMDVAAFVGFSARGPLDTPVPIEDVAQLRDLFGDPPLLAWDMDAGAWQPACLGLAVADFFAQGGQRCWVVRVAGAAQTNVYPIAGLLRATSSSAAPAFARARCAGSWSDDLVVGASLLVEALACEPFAAPPGQRIAGNFSLGRGTPLQAGDVLQLTFDGNQIAYLRAETVTPDGDWQRIEGEARWFAPVTADDTPIVGTLTLAGSAAVPNVTLSFDSDSPQLIPATVQPESGDWLTLDSPAGRIWIVAEQSLDALISVRHAWREVNSGGAVDLLRAARVTMALEAREAQQSRGLLSDLALSAPHPYFWGYLPDDETLYRLPMGQPEAAQGQPGAALSAEAAATPRYPLAAESDPGDFYLPLGLEVVPFAWRASLPVAGSALERDGLVPPAGTVWTEFLQQIYLDPALRWSGEDSLLADAFDLRYVQGVELRGLHSILPLDEVSMLALPDAAQRGWYQEAYAILPPPPAPPAPPPPAPCGDDSVFSSKADPADQADPAPSAPISASAAPQTRWTLVPDAAYDGTGLLEVQQRAAEFASARADFMAVLSIPAHYRTRDALDHRSALRKRLTGRLTASFAALTHPCLIERDADGSLSRCGAEGVLCGMMALRGLRRGAWVSPANQTARSAVALVPQFDNDDLADLYTASFNIFRPDARGFVLWGSSTLSDDPDYTALNVRRLLILLRRVALREGQEYVFQPHSPAFQRQVKRNMERLLATLFQGGAFAGNSPTDAYLVTTDSTVNTQSSIEQGRFIVELRVAPSLPLAFIVVRLIETSSGTLVVQEA